MVMFLPIEDDYEVHNVYNLKKLSTISDEYACTYVYACAHMHLYIMCM